MVSQSTSTSVVSKPCPNRFSSSAAIIHCSICWSSGCERRSLIHGDARPSDRTDGTPAVGGLRVDVTDSLYDPCRPSAQAGGAAHLRHLVAALSLNLNQF